MRILKRFVEEETWEETTEEECLDHTEGSGYWKKGSVLGILADGEVVFTPFARYKMDDCKHEYERYVASYKGGQVKLHPQGRILICKHCNHNSWRHEQGSITYFYMAVVAILVLVVAGVYQYIGSF